MRYDVSDAASFSLLLLTPASGFRIGDACHKLMNLPFLGSGRSYSSVPGQLVKTPDASSMARTALLRRRWLLHAFVFNLMHRPTTFSAAAASIMEKGPCDLPPQKRCPSVLCWFWLRALKPSSRTLQSASLSHRNPRPLRAKARSHRPRSRYVPACSSSRPKLRTHRRSHRAKAPTLSKCRRATGLTLASLLLPVTTSIFPPAEPSLSPTTDLPRPPGSRAAGKTSSASSR